MRIFPRGILAPGVQGVAAQAFVNTARCVGQRTTTSTATSSQQQNRHRFPGFSRNRLAQSAGNARRRPIARAGRAAQSAPFDHDRASLRAGPTCRLLRPLRLPRERRKSVGNFGSARLTPFGHVLTNVADHVDDFFHHAERLLLGRLFPRLLRDRAFRGGRFRGRRLSRSGRLRGTETLADGLCHDDTSQETQTSSDDAPAGYANVVPGHNSVVDGIVCRAWRAHNGR